MVSRISLHLRVVTDSIIRFLVGTPWDGMFDRDSEVRFMRERERKEKFLIYFERILFQGNSNAFPSQNTQEGIILLQQSKAFQLKLTCDSVCQSVIYSINQ